MKCSTKLAGILPQGEHPFVSSVALKGRIFCLKIVSFQVVHSQVICHSEGTVCQEFAPTGHTLNQRYKRQVSERYRKEAAETYRMIAERELADLV
jgi:hypothetical protein